MGCASGSPSSSYVAAPPTQAHGPLVTEWSRNGASWVSHMSVLVPGFILPPCSRHLCYRLRLACVCMREGETCSWPDPRLFSSFYLIFLSPLPCVYTGPIPHKGSEASALTSCHRAGLIDPLYLLWSWESTPMFLKELRFWLGLCGLYRSIQEKKKERKEHF